MLAAESMTAAVARPPTDRPSVMISGLGRVGKTLLTEQLIRSNGYRRIGTDDALEYFFSIPDDNQRLSYRTAFYAHILKRFPTGVILEGDDFILQNRVRYARTDHPIDISPARTLTERFGTELFLLGNAEASINDKIAAFDRYSAQTWCWTSELRDKPKYADWLLRVSRTLRDLADGDRIHYVEMGTDDFEDSIARTADMIAARRPRS